MPKRGRASILSTVFALVMVGFLVLGTLVVFGGSIFDSGSHDDDPSPVDESRRQIEELETRVARDPDNATDAGVLANIYANEGNLAEALPLYERATFNSPDDGNLRLAFGIALLRSGSNLDARIQLEKAHELLPENAGPPYYLGQLEERKDEPDIEAARNWYERAIDTDPESLLAGQAEERLIELETVDGTPTP